MVVHNEQTGSDGGAALLERIRREIHAFPVLMGWCKTVNFDVPTSAAFLKPPPDIDATADAAAPGIRSSEQSPEQSGGGYGERSSGSDEEASVGVAIPSYAAQGNFLEVGREIYSRGCRSWRGVFRGGLSCRSGDIHSYLPRAIFREKVM